MALPTTIECLNWIKPTLLVILALSLIGISKNFFLAAEKCLWAHKLQVSTPQMCF